MISVIQACLLHVLLFIWKLPFPQTAGKVLQTHCKVQQPQSNSALGMQQGTSVPLALCCQHRQCVAAIRPLRTALLEVSLCCVLPCSQRTEQKRHSENRLVFIGGLFVGCADLASAPSGGAWNKSFAGGNALELPTQDIYSAVAWCHSCQWGDSVGCWRPGILPLKNWCSGRVILCTHTISCQDCA